MTKPKILVSRRWPEAVETAMKKSMMLLLIFQTNHFQPMSLKKHYQFTMLFYLQ